MPQRRGVFVSGSAELWGLPSHPAGPTDAFGLRRIVGMQARDLRPVTFRIPLTQLDSQLVRTGDRPQWGAAWNRQGHLWCGQTVPEAPVDCRLRCVEPRDCLAARECVRKVVGDEVAQDPASAEPGVYPHPGEPGTGDLRPGHRKARERICAIHCGERAVGIFNSPGASPRDRTVELQQISQRDLRREGPGVEAQHLLESVR